MSPSIQQAQTPYPRYRPQMAQQFDDQGNPIDPNQPQPGADAPAGVPPVGAPNYIVSPGADPGQLGGVPNTYQGGFDNNSDPSAQMAQNRMRWAGQGAAIDQETTSAQDLYGGLEQGYRGAADTAYTGLAKQPGYTPGQESQINVDYGANKTSQADLQKQYLTGDEQAGMSGDPNAPVQTMAAGVDAEGKQLNAFGTSLGGTLAADQAAIGGTLGAYQENLGGQVKNYQDRTGKAVGQLDTGLQDAQGGFSKLDSAVGDKALGFDPNATEKQLTDADVQQMKTAAGTRIGNQYRSAQDQLKMNAAAEGNTSPMAIAAANARLQTQEASDQGNAETNADIAARQAQYTRAAGIEQQRLGATQTQAGMKAGAAATEQSQAQAAAGLAGTQGIAAAEQAGQAGINAANTYGQTATGAVQDFGKTAVQGVENYGNTAVQTGSDMASKQYGAATTAEQEGAARAGTIATNRQQTQAGVNNTGYTQGMQTQGATAAGAKTVGDAQIAGQNAYRGYLTSQQAAAQQGGQTARQQQIGAFGTQAGAVNTSSGQKSAQDLGSSKNDQGWVSTIGNLFEDGGVVDKPTLGVLGEHGPEMVVPLGEDGPANYSSQTGQSIKGAVPSDQGQQSGGKSAAETIAGLAGFDQGGIVTQPTLAKIGESGPEAVVPMGSDGAAAQPWYQKAGARYGQAQAGRFQQSPAGAVVSGIQRYRQNQANNRMQGQVAQAGDQATQDMMGGPQGSMMPPPPVGQQQTPPDDMPYMAGGDIVTKPTVAMLGDKGPEAVVPLHGDPAQMKVSPSMIGAAMKNRYRRPTGPAGPHGPSRPLTQLMPNRVFR